MHNINIFSHVKCLCLLWALVVVPIGAVAQGKADKKVKQSYQIIVTDESGAALPSAQIVVGEGESFAVADNNGKAAIDAATTDYVKVSLQGYADNFVVAENLRSMNTVALKKLNAFATGSDLVPMPFANMYKRNITSSTVVISGKDLEKYPGSDIRNAFTGLATGLDVRELNGSPGLNVIERYNGNPEKIDVLLRGRSPMFIVDGTPADMTEMPLDPSEIESATIVKDIVAKAMYGPVAADGIVYIRTYRGKRNERAIKVNAEKGVNFVDRMPKWTNGAEYAQLNNLARYNSNLRDGQNRPMLYSQNAIDKYAVNNGYDMFYPNSNYRDMMFKNSMEYNRANVSTSGGNEGIQYFSYLGYTNESDLFKIGSTANYNRIVSRSNLDIRINNYIKMRLGVYGAMGLRRSPVYNSGGEYLAMNSAIVDANTTPPIEFPVYANNSPELDKPWYAVSASYGNNPIGELAGQGFGNEAARIGSSNLAFDFDMSHLVKGLSSETYMGFNILNQVRMGKVEDYAAYIVRTGLTSDGRDTIMSLDKVHDGVDKSDQSKLSDYYFQTFVFNQTFRHNAQVGKANLANAVTYSMTRAARDGYTDDQRQQSIIWNGNLVWDDKYILQGVVDYAGTYSFAKENRYDIFPSVGAGWIVSEESFMKPLQCINYLKLRAEGGVLGYDNFQAPFYYRDDYNTSTSGAFGPSTSGWLGSATETSVPRTTPGRIGNPDLSWEKRREFNLGVDASLLSNKLSVEVTYFNQLRDGIIGQVWNTLPDVAGIGSTPPKLNFEKVRYTGVEGSIFYSDKIGGLNYRVGGSAMTFDGKYERVDDPDFRYDYQSRLGKSIYTIYGLTYTGRYQSDAETLLEPSLYDEKLHAGDLRYLDKNDDDVIDDNDRSAIGRNMPKLIYSVNIDLSFKNFELSVVGTGRAFYDIALTNSYFWNGWGNGNYSEFVRNNFNTGNYPTLTYDKVENNFKESDFWLKNGGFFKIQNARLAYNLPKTMLDKVGLKGVCLFVNGANLYTFTKIKYVDPESINAGVNTYPLFRNVTGGVKLTF